MLPLDALGVGKILRTRVGCESVGGKTGCIVVINFEICGSLVYFKMPAYPFHNGFRAIVKDPLRSKTGGILAK